MSAWLDGLTIPQVLDHTVERFGDRDALVFPKLGLKLSYREFTDRIDEVARGLLGLGIRTGEHVAVWATNMPEWVLLQFATARIGVVLVTINPAYRAHELKYVLKQSDAVALVLTDRFKSSDYFAMLAEVCPEVQLPLLPGEGGGEGAGLELPAHSLHPHPALSQGERVLKQRTIQSAEFPKLRQVVAIKGEKPIGALSWAQLLAAGQNIAADELKSIGTLLKRTDAINIQYTSGTTGFPKAATLSHRNLLLNVFYSGACQALSEQDRICIPVPFYHCFGCVLGTLMAVAYGAAMVVPAESFDPKATLDAIEQARCTALYGVPTMFIAQLNDETLPGRDLKSLRTGIMAGSPCPIETMRAVVNTMGCREITIGYGQTEASPIITQTRTDDPIELRVETVGRPLPGVEVRVVDPGSGAELPDNQQGELCARGHVVMLGYYNNPEATQNAIDSHGWLHTGDLAVRLPNGYYKITGRIKDMVIRGGENIYPREIEEFLFTHPAIEQAAVVGVPDPKYGEELCAWIKLKAGCINSSPSRERPGEGESLLTQPPATSLTEITEDTIRQFCRSKLAHYKVPRYVKFVTAFPQTVTGKIQKFKIREQMCCELGLKEQETA